jgi:hypothetical protein
MGITQLESTIRTTETVSEVEKEAGASTQCKQHKDHHGTDMRTGAITGSGWEKHFKGEKRPGRKKVDKQRGL